jgi:3-hydroxyanthranilate 3,4-dioxygenase
MAKTLRAFNLKSWIEEHRHLLKPPVGAEMIWKDSEFMIMAIGGPNARRDFHIDPADEFFFQIEGDIVLEYIDREGKRQREAIREGDVFLLPANTPHSPQRPAGGCRLSG